MPGKTDIQIQGGGIMDRLDLLIASVWGVARDLTPWYLQLHWWDVRQNLSVSTISICSNEIVGIGLGVLWIRIHKNQDCRTSGRIQI
jgi:hypothetical protein